MCYGVEDVVDTSNYEDDFKKDSCKTTFKLKNIESDAVEILRFKIWQKFNRNTNRKIHAYNM